MPTGPGLSYEAEGPGSLRMTLEGSGVRRSTQPSDGGPREGLWETTIGRMVRGGCSVAQVMIKAAE